MAAGVDPIDHRKGERAKAIAAVPVPTFDVMAQAYIAAHSPSWRNVIHHRQWVGSLRTYVSPIIGQMPVSCITTEHVMRCIEPHWTTKTESMSRIRGRIESVLDYAKARKHRDGDNPASWSVIEHLLPKPGDVAKVEHFAALDYRAIGTFVANLRRREGIGALALEFAVLTAARSGEVLGMTWGELDGDVWIIPPERMKAKKEHRVPLSKSALTVLEKVREITTKFGGKVTASKFVFPNSATGHRMNRDGLLGVLKRMGRAETVHGFRSSFRDWAAEQTAFPSEMAELALAHSVGNKVEQAYRRGDMFAKRRRMMQAWADYCGTPPIVSADDDNVVPMRV